MDQQQELLKLRSEIESLKSKNQALRNELKREHFTNQLFTKSEDLFCISNSHGIFIEVNPAFTSNLGYTREELIGHNFTEFIIERDLKRTSKEVEAFLQQGKKLVQFKNRYKTKAGEVIWLSWTAYFDLENNLVYSSARNVTEQKKSEDRLRLLESAILNTKDAIVITKANGLDEPNPKIIYCNQAFYDKTGYKEEEVIGKSPRILQGKNTSIETKKKIRKAMENWEPIEIDILNYKKDNTPFWVNLSIVPVADKSGSFTHWVSTQREVTQRVQLKKKLEEDISKRTEALEKSNRKLEKFVYVASHDLKAPLRRISSFLQLLNNNISGKINEKEREYFDYAITSASEAHQLVEDILKYSLIDTNSIYWKQTNITELVESQVRNLKVNDTAKPLKIIYHNLPCIICDETQIKQLFQNLIENAIKFNDKDFIDISIDFVLIENGVEFTIKDNGPGINEENLNRIFDLFGRGDKKNLSPGQGLGLAICQEIVENHFGKIWVESKAGEGATFHFTLFPVQ